jgi:hypothetical protein
MRLVCVAVVDDVVLQRWSAGWRLAMMGGLFERVGQPDQ